MNGSCRSSSERSCRAPIIAGRGNEEGSTLNLSPEEALAGGTQQLSLDEIERIRMRRFQVRGARHELPVS